MLNVIVLFFVVNASIGQEFGATVKSYLQQNQKEFQLEPYDFSDISISSQNYSKSLNAYNVYAEQNFRGIKIFNSVSPFVIKENRVINAKSSFVRNISAKANSTTPSISAINAISRATAKLGVASPTDLRLLETLDNQSYVFSNGNISLENIPVQLVYQPMNDGNVLKLALDLSIYILDGGHYYSVRVDALSGDILDVHDWVVSCDLGEVAHSHTDTGSILFPNYEQGTSSFSSNAVANSATPKYRVFPIPFIGPNEGVDKLVTDPSNATASPYGWHDMLGIIFQEPRQMEGMICYLISNLVYLKSHQIILMALSHICSI